MKEYWYVRVWDYNYSHSDFFQIYIYMGYFRWSQQLKILKLLKIFLHLVFYEKKTCS